MTRRYAHAMSDAHAEPVVDEVLRFETAALGTSADRRAIVRWSDGTEGQALAWYSDEILICERRPHRQD